MPPPMLTEAEKEELERLRKENDARQATFREKVAERWRKLRGQDFDQ
jgi:hypothetical protein